MNRHYQNLSRFLPFISWIPELKKRGALRADIIAGITVALLLIPQSMAYANLAGLPVSIGLYAAFIPPIIAALFGSSWFLSTGPVPVSSLLTAVALMPLVVSGSPAYLQYVFLLTLLAGIIQLVLGVIRFGVVVNFLSYPVILGFINAVALIIASMQLGNLFGVSTVTATYYYQTFWQVLTDAIANPHWPTVGIALLAFIIIWGGKKRWPRLPHTIIAVIVTTIISWAIGYEKSEVINSNQILSNSIQQTIKHFEKYPQDLLTLTHQSEHAQNELQEIIDKQGEESEASAEASNAAEQVDWKIKRLIARHQAEAGELNRLRLQKLTLKDGQIIYLKKGESVPAGEFDHHVWRVAQLPKNGRLTVQSGGAVVGRITPGLPEYRAVSMNWDSISRLFMPALIIALVGFTEAITIAKRIATQTRQRINVNQELIGQGLAKMIGSFFQSMPVSGGFTRTAINFYAGARTGFSSIISGLMVMVVLLWLTPVFYYLPYATLAVIVMIGVLGLIDIREAYRVCRVSKKEGVVLFVTFGLTLFLAPKLAHAILFAILFSLGLYLFETMRPAFKELVRSQDGDLVEQTGEEKTCELATFLRFSGSLYFGNAAYFEQEILKLITAKKNLRYIILDCVSIHKLDASGLQVLCSVGERLKEAGIELWFSRLRAPILSVLKRGGVYEQFNDHFYKSNEKAVEALLGKLGEKHQSTCPLHKRPG